MKGLAILGALAALGPGLAVRVENEKRSESRRRGSSRDPKLLFSAFYWRSEFDQLSATLKSLQATVEAQATKISAMETAVNSSQSNDAATTYTAIFSNITDVYSKVQQNRKDIDKKCPRSKCDKILKKVKKVKAMVEFIQTTNITVLESLVEMLQSSSSTGLLTDLAPIKACMTDPTASACTTTYGGSSTLPGALASAQTSITALETCMQTPAATGCTTGNTNGATGSLPAITAAKCSDTTCTTLQTSVTNLETCMQTPAATGCTSGNTNGASGSLPAITATAATDLGVLKECFTDPTATACTGTYSTTAVPATLPGALAAKCTSTTCTSLQTSLTALDACMQTPTGSSCTVSTNANGASGSLPDKVALLTSCMTTPGDAACTIKSTTTSVPYQVYNLDKCMEGIEDATCAATYGDTAKFISSGGTGMVAWLQQLRKPSSVQCSLGITELTFPNFNAGKDTSVTGSTEPAILPACDVATQWEKIKWASCTSTDQPDNSNKQTYHMEATTDKDEVTINKAGTYHIGLTALMKATDKKQLRTEVYKISSKDPTSSPRCGAITSACTTLMQLRVQSKFGTTDTDNTGERSTNGEGVFSLCDGDKIFVIASKGGAAGTLPDVTISKDTDTGIRTRLTVTKIGWLDGTP